MTALLAFTLAGLILAGCCGGSPSHKCEFGPPTPKDATPDMGLPCGTGEMCNLPQVCCVTKVPLVAACVDQEEFIPRGCEKLSLPCAVPSDCPSGLVCCVAFAVSEITCAPASLCPGDGVNTLRVCSTDRECTISGNTCQPVDENPDAGAALKVCI